MKKISKLITKEASVGGLTITEDELALINKQTLISVSADEIFIFKIAVCNNEVDRDFEVLPIVSLAKLAELFVGKTVIKDHAMKSENQVARIYRTRLEKGTGITQNGENYTQLIAHCYMLRTDSTKDLIAEIGAGIKKEVSISCNANSIVCSICGTDNKKQYCKHYNGILYDGKKCYFKILDIFDAYEVSFVAVPALPQAGVIKAYGEKPVEQLKDEEKNKKIEIVLAIAKAYNTEGE